MQTLLDSPLGLLRHLPCAAPSAPPPHLRRAASMQTLRIRSGSGGSIDGSGSGSGSPPYCVCGSPYSDSGALPHVPSLAAVQEHQPVLAGGGGGLGHHSSSAPHLPSAAAPAAAADRQQQSGGSLPPCSLSCISRRRPCGSLPPRRSHSDSALCLLPRQTKPQRWLAELSRQPRPPTGWGLCTAATLQDVACRALCASLVQRWQEQHGGRRQLPASLVQAVEMELRRGVGVVG